MGLSLLIHADPAHAAANAACVLLFAPPLIRAVGFLRVALLFIVTGLAGNAAAQWIAGHPVIGASAGVSGLMAAHMVLCPRARLAGLPLAPMIALWIALQALLLFAATDPTLGGIAWHAHLIGAALGIGLGGFLRRWSTTHS